MSTENTQDSKPPATPPLPPATGYTADVIQYMMPDGRQVPTSTKLPMDSHEAYLDMQKHGCNFGAEMLMTGEISVTIEDPKEEVDVDIEVIPNGPDVQKGMVAMLNRRLWREPYESSSGTGSAEPASTGEGARAPSLFPAAHGSANCKRRVRNEAEREAGAEPGETNL